VIQHEFLAFAAFFQQQRLTNQDKRQGWRKAPHNNVCSVFSIKSNYSMSTSSVTEKTNAINVRLGCLSCTQDFQNTAAVPSITAQPSFQKSTCINIYSTSKHIG
jgi:hypothetical protein